MTQTADPSTPGTQSNVVPMSGSQPAIWPPQPPWLRPGPTPPSCFSQLYALNQCYDDIIAMKQILAKVICDMAATDPAFQKCLAEAIAASGSSVPLIGVTNGSDAQPGQVGEYIQMSQTLTYPAATATTLNISMGVLQPGDWDVWAAFETVGSVQSIDYTLNPQPAGFSTQLGGGISLTGPTQENLWLTGFPSRASISVPTLLAFVVRVNVFGAGGTSTQGLFVVGARRAR